MILWQKQELPSCHYIAWHSGVFCCDKPARREVDISGFRTQGACFPRGLAQTQKGKAGALPSLGMICLSRARTRQVLIGLGAGCGGTDRRHIFPDAECRPRRD